MSLIPNIQLFATDPDASLNKESITNAGEEQGFLVRCTDEVYKILKKNKQLIADNLYFVSYGGPSSSNLTATTCLYMGDKLIGNSGVLFIEATNGFARIKGNKINLTAPTALTSALHGNPGQVVFVVNHTVDEVTKVDQYNTFMYLWKSIEDKNNASNTEDGEWINANLNYTLTGIDNLGNADLEFTESLSTTPNENTLYILDPDTKIPEGMQVTDRTMYVYDAASGIWVAISGGVGRNSDYATDAHTFNNYVDNLAKAKGANAFNEKTVASARFSNAFGYKSESNDLAGMTGGIKNINSGAAGIVVGTNNEVGQYFTYCFTFYDDDKPRVFISSATGNVIAPNFDIGGKLIFTNKNHLVSTASDYCCNITDYSHNDNCLFVDHIPAALFNWFDELTTEDGSSTNRYRVKENTLVKFIQEDSTAGASVSSTATDLDNIEDDNYLGGANNVVGGHNNNVRGANDAVVGNNLKTKEDNVALFGEFNKETAEATVMTLGNGTDEDHRSNAMVVYKSGTAELSGGTGDKTNSVATRGFVTDILTDANYMGVLIYGAGKSDERGSAITSGLNRLIVDVLPTDKIDTNTIYMLRKSEPENDNTYDEYMYINSAWEIIGSSATNMTGYVTSEEHNTLVEQVNNLNSVALTRTIVNELPNVGQENVVYMILDDEGDSDSLYNEYLFVNGQYELIGNTSVDLSGYVTTSQYESLLSRIEDLEYEPIKITSFSIDPSGLREIGNPVLSQSYYWSTNKQPASITVDGLNIADTSLTEYHNNGINRAEDYTVSISVTDERGAIDSMSKSVNFCHWIYWGVTSDLNEFTRDDLLNIASSGDMQLSVSINRTISLTTGEGQYMYYAIPKSSGTAQFKVGGFDGGFNEPIEQTITTGFGLEVDYLIYKSTNSNLGTQTVVVSKGA